MLSVGAANRQRAGVKHNGHRETAEVNTISRGRQAGKEAQGGQPPAWWRSFEVPSFRSRVLGIEVTLDRVILRLATGRRAGLNRSPGFTAGQAERDRHTRPSTRQLHRPGLDGADCNKSGGGSGTMPFLCYTGQGWMEQTATENPLH